MWKRAYLIKGRLSFCFYFFTFVCRCICCRKPTVHLISFTDFLDATAAAILLANVNGIYHLGDEGIQTLQTFFDDITTYAGNRRPWRMPVWMIMTAASVFECFSKVFGTRSPLTVDFKRIGMASYYGDTSRMRKELLPKLKYKTYKEGMDLLKEMVSCRQSHKSTM